MTLAELKSFLETLSEEQLKQPAIIFQGDETDGLQLDHWETSQEDVYWERHGDCLGNLDQAKEALGDDWDYEHGDLVIYPKGSVGLFTL